MNRKTSLEIKKAIPEQADEIFAMITACRMDMEEKQIFQWIEQYPTIRHITASIDHGTAYILHNGVNIVGTVNLSDVEELEHQAIAWHDAGGKALVIYRLAVHPAHQQLGYARMLMGFAEEYASANGYTSVKLDAYSGNERVLRFYENRGYQERGTVYFKGRSLPFHCYEKAVLQAAINPGMV